MREKGSPFFRRFQKRMDREEYLSKEKLHEQFLPVLERLQIDENKSLKVFEQKIMGPLFTRGLVAKRTFNSSLTPKLSRNSSKIDENVIAMSYRRKYGTNKFKTHSNSELTELTDASLLYNRIIYIYIYRQKDKFSTS